MKIRLGGGTVHESLATMVEIPATLSEVKKYLEPMWGTGYAFISVELYHDEPMLGWEKHYAVKINGITVAYTDDAINFIQ